LLRNAAKPELEISSLATSSHGARPSPPLPWLHHQPTTGFGGRSIGEVETAGAHESRAGLRGWRDHLLRVERPPQHGDGEEEVELPGLSIVVGMDGGDEVVELHDVGVADEAGRVLPEHMRRLHGPQELLQLAVLQDQLGGRGGGRRHHGRRIARAAYLHGRLLLIVSGIGREEKEGCRMYHHLPFSSEGDANRDT
ncbi:unnamed protein product, partial [Musa acuminata subsp. burmannicoides]